MSDGRGSVQVEGEVTELRWEEGLLALEVTAAPGREVRVATEEATVRVIGTGLSVERGPFGTEVRVSHGVVVATCRGLGEEERLEAGDAAECFRDAGTGLGRVLALEAQGAPAEVRLPVIERALRHATTVPATHTVLVERKVDALVALARVADAVEAAGALPNRVARWTQGARDAMATGCGAARPWLEALSGSGDPAGALLLVQCLADVDRAGAARLVSELDGAAWGPQERAALEAWRAALARPLRSGPSR